MIICLPIDGQLGQCVVVAGLFVTLEIVQVALQGLLRVAHALYFALLGLNLLLFTPLQIGLLAVDCVQMLANGSKTRFDFNQFSVYYKQKKKIMPTGTRQRLRLL